MTGCLGCRGGYAWVGVLVVVLSCAANLAEAQPAPTGYVSLFADHLPNRDATELRARVFAEETIDAGSRLRLIASGFVEGLVADRKRSTITDGVAEAHELTATVRTKRFDLAAGLGRVVWGRLDELQPTDVVNPIDVSRFFFEGRAEARLAVPLVRGTLYAGERVSIEGVYVPFFRRGRFDRLAEASSPFALTPDVPLLDRSPARIGGNAQGGARASFTTGRVDWSVSAYRGFRPFGIYAAGPAGVERVYPRFTMAGADFETVAGAWVVRGELAAFTRDAFQAPAAAVLLTGRSFDAGGGVDRKAGQYRVSGQVLVHREEYEGESAGRTDVSLIVSADRSFARQQYEGRLFGVYNPASGAAFVRGVARAALRDNVALEGSLGWFGRAGVDTIGRFSDSDFAYLRLKYFF
jgi:hypothetical protein